MIRGDLTVIGKPGKYGILVMSMIQSWARNNPKNLSDTTN